jgi:uncharacterized protein GlcG (DUF336 family)
MKKVFCVLAICASGALADGAFVDFQTLTPELALTLAQQAMTSCEERGYQVGVTVVDRFGHPQVYLKARYAGLHIYDTSRRKAWTAVSFRTSTSELAKQTQAGSEASGIRLLGQALPLGGGLVVFSGEGSIVAGIGVSGAPGPALDEMCAQFGVDAIQDAITF